LAPDGGQTATVRSSSLVSAGTPVEALGGPPGSPASVSGALTAVAAGQRRHRLKLKTATSNATPTNSNVPLSSGVRGATARPSTFSDSGTALRTRTGLTKSPT
jgi:hypothetical protein